MWHGHTFVLFVIFFVLFVIFVAHANSAVFAWASKYRQEDHRVRPSLLTAPFAATWRPMAAP
jgi:hypothetical protein